MLSSVHRLPIDIILILDFVVVLTYVIKSSFNFNLQYLLLFLSAFKILKYLESQVLSLEILGKAKNKKGTKPFT